MKPLPYWRCIYRFNCIKFNVDSCLFENQPHLGRITVTEIKTQRKFPMNTYKSKQHVHLLKRYRIQRFGEWITELLCTSPTIVHQTYWIQYKSPWPWHIKVHVSPHSLSERTTGDIKLKQCQLSSKQDGVWVEAKILLKQFTENATPNTADNYTLMHASSSLPKVSPFVSFFPSKIQAQKLSKS